MSGLRQSNVFGSNNVKMSGGGGGGGVALLAGAGLLVIAPVALVVGTLIGGAIALMLIVLGSAAAGCLVLNTVVRRCLDVAHWKKFGQLPPPRGPVTVNLRRPAAPEQIEAPAPRVERATFWDRTYGG
jgi:hypothetical protein